MSGQSNSLTPTTFGTLGEFESVDQLLAAARGVREAGYKHYEAYSPFPVHGLDRAMGNRNTVLPWVCLVLGLSGLVGGLVLAWYTNATSMNQAAPYLIGYKYLISGKPIFSLPANIPVVFETTVLLAAFGAVFGLILLSLLPRLSHPLLRNKRFLRATSDRFFIVIEAGDPRYDREEVSRLLTSLGAGAVEDVQDLEETVG